MPSDREGFVLDGLDVNDGSDYIVRSLSWRPAPKRLAWVSSADSDGSVPSGDPRYENVELVLKIEIQPKTTQDLALAALAALTDKVQKVRGNDVILAWTPSNATNTLNLHPLEAEYDEVPIEMSGDDAGWTFASPVVTVHVYCAPFGYGDEYAGPTQTFNGSTPVASLDIGSIPGDVDAEVRIVITENSSQERDYFEWGIDQAHYNPGAPTPTIIDSDSLITSGYSGTGATRTGAYDPNASGNNVVRATLGASASAICSTGAQSHIGTFKARCRVYTDLSDAQVRLAWRVGDGPWSYSPWQLALAANFTSIDLGTISIPVVETGTQSWEGKIQAYSPTGGALDVDYIEIKGAERYGVARAPVISALQSDTFAARDSFDQAANPNLTGQAAAIGGTWTNVASGDADDFTVDSTAHTAKRTAVSDANLQTGRLVSVGTTSYAGVQVGVKVDLTSYPNTDVLRAGVFARLVDINNYIALVAGGLNAANGKVKLVKRVAGVETILMSVLWLRGQTSLILTIDPFGNWAIDLVRTDKTTTISGTDSDLGISGVLATGKVGLIDAYTSATALTRTYDELFAYASPTSAVCLSGKHLEIRANGDDPAIREAASGGAYGRVPVYRAGRPLVPCAGADGKTARLITKLRRNDIDGGLPEANIADAHNVAVFLTPRYLLPRP